MREIKESGNKAVAAISALALVLSSSFGVAASTMTAYAAGNDGAAENTTVIQVADNTNKNVSKQNTSKATPVPMADNEGIEYLGVNAEELLDTDNTTNTTNTTDTSTPDTSKASGGADHCQGILSVTGPVATAPVKFGEKLTFAAVMRGPASTDDGGIFALDMQMTGVPTDLLEGVSSKMYYSTDGSSWTEVPSTGGSFSGTKFVFTETWLQANVVGGMQFKLETTGTLANDKSKLDKATEGQYKKDWTINVTANDCTAPASAPDHADYVQPHTFQNSGSIVVNVPVLQMRCTKSTSSTNIFGPGVDYELTVANINAGTTAKNVVIEDKQGADNLFSLGLSPESIKVTLGGSTLAEGTDYTKSLDNGNLTISLKKDLLATQQLVVSYHIAAGLDSMKTDKSALAKMIEMDAANGFADRSATVSAADADPTAAVMMSSDLLVPKAAISQSIASPSLLTTGETSKVSIKYTISGDTDAVLVDPAFTYSYNSDQTGCTISNPKLKTASGTMDYTPGMKFDAKSGDVIEFTCDVTAPASHNNNQCVIKAVLSAANLVENFSANVPISVAVPALTAAVVVDNQTPSAEDEAQGDNPVKVTATFQETDANAVATGALITIVDSSEDEILDRRFQNVMINGVLADAGEYVVSGNELTIKKSQLNKNETITVSYDDYLKTGYEGNGKTENIVATIGADPSVASNIPADGKKEAKTSFTVQTPLLHNAKAVTAPLDDEDKPSPVNVNDRVSIKSVIYEWNEAEPAALGRDFKFVETIQPIVLGAEKKKVAEEEGIEEAEPVADENETSTDEADVKTSSVKDADSAKVKPAATDDDSTAKVDLEETKEYKPAALGIVFDPASIRVLVENIDGEVQLTEFEDTADLPGIESEGEEEPFSNYTDVTDLFDIAPNSDKSSFTITAKAGTDANLSKLPLYVEYDMIAGTPKTTNYDLLAGEIITTESSLTVSNLEKPATAISETLVADAEISMSKSAQDKEISFGDTDTYTIKIVNDPEDKYNENSQIRGLSLDDMLDDATVAFGYRMDPASIKVSLDGEDITDDAEVHIVWNADATQFTFDYDANIAKKSELVITYDATTVNILADSFTQTLGNVAVATADNSRPAINNEIVMFLGNDLPVPETGAAGGQDFGGTMSKTGDNFPLFALGGVIAVAVIGGAVVFVLRRRSNK